MVMDMMTDTVNLIDASASEIVLHKKYIGEKHIETYICYKMYM